MSGLPILPIDSEYGTKEIYVGLAHRNESTHDDSKITLSKDRRRSCTLSLQVISNLVSQPAARLRVYYRLYGCQLGNVGTAKANLEADIT